MNPRIILTAAIAGLFCAQALVAQPVKPPVKPPAKPAAAVAAGPWAKVPALPTACYAEQDQWRDQNYAALEAVRQDHEKQKEANSEVEQRFRSIMEEDPLAMTQALQQAMLNDPQNAQKIMQQLTQTGEEGRTEIPAQAHKDSQFQADAKVVIEQYRAALEKAYGPGDARWSALKKKAGYPPDLVRPSETGGADWMWAEWELVLRDWKAGYEANCATWFATTGPLHAFMKRYKDYLVNERIPTEKRLIDQPRLDQYEMMNIPTTGWRTTSDYDAAEMYMRLASEVFSERRETAACAEIGCR